MNVNEAGIYDYPELRQQIIETAQAIGSSGLGQGTSGNVSVRVEGGFLVTPSAIPYTDCEPEDVVWVDMSGDPQGRRKPSSEWRFHRDIYAAREDANAIVHAHSPACTTLACLHKAIPAFHYMVAIGGGDDIRCAAYATFGSQELSDFAVRALENRSACLLANHGMICLADDLPHALALAEEVESLASIYCDALKVGEPHVLSKQQMEEVLVKFEDYKKISSTINNQ